LPYEKTSKWVPPRRVVRDDKEIGNSSAWSVVERAKNAGVPEVQGWRRDKFVSSAAEELRCYDSINAIIESLEGKIRQRRGKR